jgi:hypothetical protein
MEGITLSGVEAGLGIGLMALGSMNLIIGSVSTKRKGKTGGVLLDIGMMIAGFALYSYSGESLSSLATEVENSAVVGAVL